MPIIELRHLLRRDLTNWRMTLVQIEEEEELCYTIEGLMKSIVPQHDKIVLHVSGAKISYEDCENGSEDSDIDEVEIGIDDLVISRDPEKDLYLLESPTEPFDYLYLYQPEQESAETTP